MKFESFGLSDRGLRRHHNEDAFLLRDDLGLVVVADGMGGHAAGEVAAGIAVSEVECVIEANRGLREETWPAEWDVRLSFNANCLGRAITSAHRRVTGAVEGNLGLRGMGATVVAALFDGEQERLTVAHVGDSRAYLLRGGEFDLLTSDHSWVHEQVVAGLLTEDAARNHPLKNVVTRALGGAQEPLVDILEVSIATGDLVLLCSDGLNTMLEDGEVAGVIGRFPDIKLAARELVAEANRRGGLDNITVALVRSRA
ncbi:MAG: protein phosphatase 2C domain-containing protein [Acidobacteriota bacterium]